MSWVWPGFALRKKEPKVSEAKVILPWVSKASGLNCRFINTHVGSRGKMCNARVLRKAGIYRAGQIGTNFPLNVVAVINEVLVPTIILEACLWLYIPWKKKSRLNTKQFQ